jgi:hypothetical protein
MNRILAVAALAVALGAPIGAHAASRNASCNVHWVIQKFDGEALLGMMRLPENVKIIDYGSCPVENAGRDICRELIGRQGARASPD